jgi:hypothetical protein
VVVENVGDEKRTQILREGSTKISHSHKGTHFVSFVLFKRTNKKKDSIAMMKRNVGTIVRLQYE